MSSNTIEFVRGSVWMRLPIIRHGYVANRVREMAIADGYSIDFSKGKTRITSSDLAIKFTLTKKVPRERFDPSPHIEFFQSVLTEIRLGEYMDDQVRISIPRVIADKLTPERIKYLVMELTNEDSDDL